MQINGFQLFQPLQIIVLDFGTNMHYTDIVYIIFIADSGCPESYRGDILI